MYFTCELKTVKQGGIEFKNALIVNGIQYGETQPDLTFAVPEAYKGVGYSLIGCRYIPESQTFEQVDVEVPVREPTQADRTESLALQSALNTEYIASLIELGL